MNKPLSRNYSLDNAKFILITPVIIGDLIEPALELNITTSTFAVKK